MKEQRISSVIGKNFGDEGKGLAVDFLCSRSFDSLVIKHNGGAQAGHTVDYSDKRFVFHQLSSGSFRNAATFFSDTYYPDLYKLKQEVDDFKALAGFVPPIYCEEETPIVLIDDVLMNMALETLRGKNRHGSCGMGIYEAYLRTQADYEITMREVLSGGAADLAKRMLVIREEYGERHIKSLVTEALPAQYEELLKSKDVILNVAEEMRRNAEFLQLASAFNKISSYENVVFETGQGLLLDSECEKFAPHVSASKTGLTNPLTILQKVGLSLTDVFYVTRSYVTRHGAGSLPYECTREELGIKQPDRTNQTNEWQGSLRYAKHGTYQEFVAPILEDLSLMDMERMKKPNVFLFVTHLNETNGKICFADKEVKVTELNYIAEIGKVFDEIYISATPYAGDVNQTRE